MRMFDFLTSGAVFVGRRGWGVLAVLGLAFGVILALGGSWVRWGYFLFLLFPALEDARTGYVSDGWDSDSVRDIPAVFRWREMTSSSLPSVRSWA